MKAKHIVGISVIIAIMITITIFSAQTATESDALSKGIVKQVAVGLGIMTEEEANSTHYSTIKQWDHYLRKATHFTIYFILGFITFMVLYAMIQKKAVALIVAWLIATVFAIFDEYHQTFVDGRGGQVSDVILDSAGALTAVVLGTLLIGVFRKNKGE
ncbi:VanZ family protein [Vallitalea pronyensis]|uniref:VanZ family protein n=1 Tax=Vallitalea pronyensis TaxID=1348613 RepID=A0A8J8MP62_9FIRM|nr:VanZ family protein [Vallitalea pronyensis]QUI24997.1 VanZ family protein [Vallitalea pronyensis]